MYIQTKEKQMFIEENIKAIRQLLEKQFDLYSKKKIDEKEETINSNNNHQLIAEKQEEKTNKALCKEKVEIMLKPKESIHYVKVYVEGQIFLDLPAIKTAERFNFKQYSKAVISQLIVVDGQIYIKGYIRKKFIYTAMVGRLGVPKYGLVKDIPFECKINSYDIKKSDIYNIIPNIEIITQYCKLCCFSKNSYGDEIANCCIEKDTLRIGIVKLN